MRCHKIYYSKNTTSFERKTSKATTPAQAAK